MDGRRATVLAVLLTALATMLVAGCDDGGAAGDAAPQERTTGTIDVSDKVPELTGRLKVRLATGLQVMGMGCRQRSVRDACAVDGSATYTWLGKARPAVVTSVRMHPDAGHGAWVVVVRFARPGRSVAQQTASRAQGMGGYVLLLDAESGDALQAARPDAVESGRITVPDLAKPDAWDLVTTYVTRATSR